jgi:hypothetical protein
MKYYGISAYQFYIALKHVDESWCGPSEYPCPTNFSLYLANNLPTIENSIAQHFGSL